MTEAEAAWLAGFLEGEGSFYTKNQPNRNYLIPIVKVNSTDKDVIERAAFLLGTSSLQFEPRRKEHWKDQWKVHIYGKRAVDIMQQILPWMGERRAAKIQEIIAAWEARPRRLESPARVASEDRQKVRQWARQQGVAVSDYGRIPIAVQNNFWATKGVLTCGSVQQVT